MFMYNAVRRSVCITARVWTGRPEY